MSPRCLMFYPWNLSDRSGALALFLSYSKALKAAGYRLDCFAPRGTETHGVFENVFQSPDSNSPLTPSLEFAAARWQDSELPDKMGRDETSMAAAAILASISDYDVVGIQYTRCHSLREMLPAGMPAVVFTHDLDSLVSRQEEMIFGTPAEYQLSDEVSRLSPFNLITAVGPDDRRLLHSVQPDLPIVEAPFTASVETPPAIREDSCGVLLWISSAATFHRFSFFWFWKNVWPRIRAERPACRLVIAGRMSEVARQLGAAEDPNVSILGVVKNTDDLYREADVMVAPYYFGLGIKTKIIEALAKGIPVATTTLGIYNTHIQPGREAVVADDASGYADQVIRLISCPERRRELVRHGQEYIRTWHDPSVALAPFVEAFEKVRLAKQRSSKSRAGALRELYEPLKHLVPWAIQRCQADDVKTVAIYGAGSHTRLLIPIWKALGGPSIRQIVVSEMTAETSLMGIPIVSGNEFDPDRIDGVVLSSHGYEDAMMSICAERWPAVRVYPIWRPVLDQSYVGLAEDFAAVCQETIPTELYDFTYDNTSTLPV